MDLGVDALWINPWYPSPMKDAGYDVSDYRDVEPVFGTLAEAEALLAEAHQLGLRVLLDIVPNHTSAQHPWFRQALAGHPGSRERNRFIFRQGRGEGGREPPNNWLSQFGGPAWTRPVDGDGQPEQWYLHLFAPEQPDLNWDDPQVAADVEQTLRFWFDRGVDGFRIDVAHGWSRLTDWSMSTASPGRCRPPATTTPSIRTGTAQRCTRSTGSGARWPIPTPTRGCSSPRRG